MIPPSPPAHFHWVDSEWGVALVCEGLEDIARHLFTTRGWALGSRAVGRDEEAAWGAVAQAIGVDGRQLARARQVHGAAVVTATVTGALPTADIIVTADGAVPAAIQTADCVPLLLADRRTGAVAAAHAGWRGLVARVPEVAVGALVDAFGSRPEDLLVAIGPSIGACCYEVGADVRAAFDSAGWDRGATARWFHDAPAVSLENPPMPGMRPHGDGAHWFLDQWGVASEGLKTAGVPPAQIFLAGLCTASHPDVFCSYRRDGVSAGRMAGAIRAGRRNP